MIAASDPQLFIPFGRKQIERHVGNSNLPLTHLSYAFPPKQDKEFVSGSENENESWIIRENFDGTEEELYIKGKVVIWSKGNFGVSLANFCGEQPGGRTLVRSYTAEHKIKQALWCSFWNDNYVLQSNGYKKKEIEVEAICAVDEKQLRIYVSGSEEYFIRLLFKVSSIWSTKYGLMIERFALTSMNKMGLSFSPFTDLNFFPTLFTLSHPLNEMSPFLILKQGGILSFMREYYMKVVYVCKNPSICMMYDYKTNLHSIWKIRKTTEEERQMMNINNDNGESSVNSHTKPFSSSMFTSSSAPFSINNKSSASVKFFTYSSPFNSRSTSQISAGHANSPFASCKIQSPLAAAVNYSNSFSTSPTNIPSKNVKFNQMKSPRFSGSPKHSPSVDARLGNSQCVQNYIPMPVQPELCLEYIWTENSGSQRDGGAMCPSSSVFISSDFVGQKHLCYLVPSRSQLFCAKLDKTNENNPEIILGNVTTITAKNAVYLPSVKVIVVLDPSNQVLLYSGTSSVGQILFGSVSSSQYLTSSYCGAPQSNVTATTSPKPFRSSMLSSTRMGEEIFDEPFQQLSPVHKHVFDERFNMSDLSHLTSSTYVESIQDSIGLQATFKYSDGTFYRVNFPVLCTSLLVKECLNTFCVILPRDVALNFMIMWYRSRNAPGTQDISTEQEWKLFLEVLLRLLGYDINVVPLMQNLYGKQTEVPSTIPKKKKECDLGTDTDWKNLLESSYHRENFIKISNLLNLKRIERSESKFDSLTYELCSSALLYPHFYIIYFSLHLLYEEFKLNTMRYDCLSVLVRLLNQLATDLNLENFLHFYWRNHPQIIARPSTVNYKNVKYRGKDTIPEYIDKPPDIFEQIFVIMKQGKVSPYPFVNQVNNMSHDILQLFSLIFNTKRVQYDDIIKCVHLPRNRNTLETIISQYSMLPNDYQNIERIISLMVKTGLTQDKLQNLPVGIAWSLIDVIHRSRECPREDWSVSEYDLLVREDLSSQVKHLSDSNQNSIEMNALGNTSSCHEMKISEMYDGMEAMDEEVMKLIWPKDCRVHQVRGMLQSSAPVVIDVQQRPDVTAHEYIEEQEKHLFGICTRTMALPVGRGMFTLRTVTPSITEPLNIPKLCLIGKSANTGTSVDFSHIEVVANMNLWPLFHNGVAAGLRISPNASIDSTWILFNKPKTGTEMLPEHAGFLMALGLNNHLKNLKRMNMFEYLSKHHAMTNVALLIGLSATFRGTMDTSTTKLLSLHIECLLPPTSLELDIDQNTQIAALLGIGLVYEKSAHRHIAEVLLSEMGRPPGPEMENSIDRESYTLSAGLALGLVLLGKGSDLSGLTDLAIADTLHYYMVGGHKRPLSGSQREKYKSPSYQIREGDVVNVDVTSPGATLALGLMFFNTGNKAIADWMKAPDTQYILDIICPDFILLRTLARGLILWEDVLPTIEYIESHIPESIRPYCLVKPKPDSVPSGIDLETMNQAYCNIVAGACMAIGLRFAGSANNIAFETVHYFCKIFITLFGKSISELAGKSTIENCLNVSLISLSMIMAGTGNVEVLRICRCLRSRVCQASNTVVTYGSHLATHMALGLLFFGGGRYSLSTSPEAIAALIIAFYPKFPTHSNDNRYHLQAFRHLYVLAAESRLLLPRDIDNSSLVYANVNMHFVDTKYYKNQIVKMMAPYLLPELKYLKKIEIKDDRYWPTVFKREKNWSQLEQILKNLAYFDIKQRTGFLPYKDDSNAPCVLTALPVTSDDCLPWSADIEYVQKYTSDSCILSLIENFFDQKNDGIISEDEIKFHNLFKRIVYECITQDKLYILSFWISMIKILQKIRRFPNAYYAWQIKLFCQSVLHCDYNNKIPAASRSLTSTELGTAVKHYLFKLIENYSKDFNLNLLFCFEETKNDVKNKFSVEQLKGTILSIYDIPVSFQLNSQLEEINPVELYSCLKKLLTTAAIKKLYETE